MKYISRILFTVGLVLGLTACTEDTLETIGPNIPTKGDMSVNITFAMPDAEAQTRSKVSGDEKRVHTMQMVCFDANGLYLGIRNAEISPYEVNNPKRLPDAGTIKGTVPQGTSRIHFIANRNLSIPLKASVGTPEEEVMASEELSTLWNENTFGTGDEAHQEVCYWGYHKEAKAADMDDWLNPTEEYIQDHGESKVYMIRDRAQVVLTYNPAATSATVTKIEWLIHHGLKRGFLAPAEASWWDEENNKENYYGKSTKEGHTEELISTALQNVYPGTDRYTLWESEEINDEKNFDTTYDATKDKPNLEVPQFLFDDSNTAIDELKAILRVTYTVDGSSKTVYHVLKLNDDDGNLYPVVRNNTYYIDVTILKPDIGFYNTLKEAIDGDEFINADVDVDREITTINNDQYTLQILLPTKTTSVVFNTVGNHTMDFAFRLVDDVTQTPDGTTTADFTVKWEKDQTFCDNDLLLAYNGDTKQFTVTANVTSVTEDLQSQWIEVKHKSGLTRYIHVFVIDQFQYVENPKLTKSGDDYLLSFKIPPAESEDPTAYIYPKGLYPIDVKFTTNTLKAYAITQNATDEYGLFGVAVESTLSGDFDLTNSANFEPGYNTPLSTITDNATNRKLWYFQQADNPWDFWYTYSIKNYDQTDEGVVKIYLKDVRNNIKYAQVSDVGLFMYINYFGKIYSMPVTTTP